MDWPSSTRDLTGLATPEDFEVFMGDLLFKVCPEKREHLVPAFPGRILIIGLGAGVIEEGVSRLRKNGEIRLDAVGFEGVFQGLGDRGGHRGVLAAEKTDHRTFDRREIRL